MRRRYDEDKKRLREKRNEKANEPKIPEKVMAETEKFSKQSAADKAAQEQRGEENLKRPAKKQAELTGKSVEEAANEMRAQAKERPYRIEEEDLRGAPFFRVEQVGGQKTIFLNRLHEFYLKLYKGQDTTDRVRDGLALMLLVFGNCELEAAAEERQRFYVQERQEWSSRLMLPSRLSTHTCPRTARRTTNRRTTRPDQPPRRAGCPEAGTPRPPLSVCTFSAQPS